MCDHIHVCPGALCLLDSILLACTLLGAVRGGGLWPKGCLSCICVNCCDLNPSEVNRVFVTCR